MAALREVKDEIERPKREVLTLMLLASECIDGSYKVLGTGGSGHLRLLVDRAGSPVPLRAIWPHRDGDFGWGYLFHHESRPALVFLGEQMWGEPSGVRRVMAWHGCVGILVEPSWRRVWAELTDLVACLEKEAASTHASDATTRALKSLLSDGIENSAKWTDVTEAILESREPGWNDALIRALMARVANPGRKLGRELDVVVSRPGEPVLKDILHAGDEWQWIARVLECRLYMPLGILDVGWLDHPLEERRRAVRAARVLVLLDQEAR